MKNKLKKAGLLLAGLLQGTLGSYLGLLGWAFAFPESGPGSKDYEEDMFFVPLGFIIMLLWIIVMVAAIVLLRKNRKNLLLFLIPWLIGLFGCLVFVFILF